jgi:hypothetical protein
LKAVPSLKSRTGLATVYAGLRTSEVVLLKIADRGERGSCDHALEERLLISR